MKKLLLLLALAAMYVAGAEVTAKGKADEFCKTIEVGQAVTDDEIVEAGLRAGATPAESGTVQDSRKAEWLLVGFRGFMPGSSYACGVRTHGGRIAEKRILGFTAIFRERAQ